MIGELKKYNAFGITNHDIHNEFPFITEVIDFALSNL